VRSMPFSSPDLCNTYRYWAVRLPNLALLPLESGQDSPQFSSAAVSSFHYPEEFVGEKTWLQASRTWSQKGQKQGILVYVYSTDT
jgi:hypothetical protein